MGMAKHQNTKPSAKRSKSADKPLSDDSVRVEYIDVDDASSHELAKTIHSHLVSMEKWGPDFLEVFPVNDLNGATKQIIVCGVRDSRPPA